jgi:hypothetical protein
VSRQGSRPGRRERRCMYYRVHIAARWTTSHIGGNGSAMRPVVAKTDGSRTAPANTNAAVRQTVKTRFITHLPRAGN